MLEFDQLVDVRQQLLPWHAHRRGGAERRRGTARCGLVGQRERDGVRGVGHAESLLEVRQGHMQLRAVEGRLSGVEGANDGRHHRRHATAFRIAQDR